MLQIQPYTYGTMFTAALKNYGILCLGLYRLLSAHSRSHVPSTSYKRYVLTNPPYDLELLTTDKVYTFFSWRRLNILNVHCTSQSCFSTSI